MRIAVFACANGLGHVRRVIAISSFLLKNGFAGKIDAFLPFTHISYLQSWSECKYFRENPAVRIIDFQYPQKYEHKVHSLYDQNWSNIILPDLKEYDIVWSDNIIRILEKRSDVLLTGSFFWHEVFAEKGDEIGLTEFVENQRAILKEFKPIMAGNAYFSTPEVCNLTQFIPVGLYRYNLLFREKETKGILYSCGLGGEEEGIARESLLKIIDENIIPPYKLFVEPRLLPDHYPEWIEKADFSSEMFNNCMAVCIRPGLGTISDSLVSRNRIFAFSKDDSFEMIHNCKVLEQMQLGKRCSSPFQAYIEALEYLNSTKEIEMQILRTSHLRTDGVFATTNLILKNINRR